PLYYDLLSVPSRTARVTLSLHDALPISLRSALILESKDPAHRERWLALRDIFARMHLRQNTLTVLSGCESGMLKPDPVDEYVGLDRKSTRLNSSHVSTSYAVFCLKQKRP